MLTVVIVLQPGDLGVVLEGGQSAAVALTREEGSGVGGGEGIPAVALDGGHHRVAGGESALGSDWGGQNEGG